MSDLKLTSGFITGKEKASLQTEILIPYFLLREPQLFQQYIYSFWWSTITLTTIGETQQPVQGLSSFTNSIDIT